MSKYETVMILNNEITEGQKNNVIAKIKNYIFSKWRNYRRTEFRRKKISL